MVVRATILRLGIFALSMACVGCAVRQPVEMQTKFDYSEHKAFMGTGPNSIRGQGFMRQKGGGVVTCAGSEVMMFPATSFFREFVKHMIAGKKPETTEKLDHAYASIIKRATCDAQGNFSFSQIPNGPWFVVTQVSWAIGYARQGGALMRQLSLSNNETMQVLLTNKDFIGR